jgi:hypothetical protein
MSFLYPVSDDTDKDDDISVVADAAAAQMSVLVVALPAASANDKYKYANHNTHDTIAAFMRSAAKKTQTTGAKRSADFISLLSEQTRQLKKICHVFSSSFRIDGLSHKISYLEAKRRSIRTSVTLAIREQLTLTTNYIDMTLRRPLLLDNKLATEAVNEGIAFIVVYKELVAKRIDKYDAEEAAIGAKLVELEKEMEIELDALEYQSTSTTETPRRDALLAATSATAATAALANDNGPTPRRS